MYYNFLKIEMYKRTLKQSSIRSLDFSQFAHTSPTKDSLQQFRDKALSFLPQALALIGREVKLVKGDDDKWSFSQTLFNLGSDLKQGKLLLDGEPISEFWMLGLLKVLNHKPRGEVLPTNVKQSSPEGSRYAANVPLVLSAFKQYRNVAYEDWSWEEDHKAIRWFVDEDNLEVVKFRGVEVNWTPQELLEFREMTNPSGKAPTAITTVTRVLDPDFKKLPRLVKLLILQLWVYHASVRNPLAICSLNDFDVHDLALVDSQVVPKSLGSADPKLQLANTLDMPW